MSDLVVSDAGTASIAGNVYCTRADLKAELGHISDTNDDTLLDLSISAASRQIDGWCGQRFWMDDTPVVREFCADNPRCLYLLDDETGDGIADTTGLIVAVDTDGDGVFENTLTIGTDFLLYPRNAAQRTPAWPYTEIHMTYPTNVYLPANLYSGRPGVQITALWGWPAVPDDVTKACLIQAGQLFKAKDAPFGVAGFGDFGAVRVRSAINPIAAGLLAPYRRPAVG